MSDLEAQLTSLRDDMERKESEMRSYFARERGVKATITDPVIITMPGAEPLKTTSTSEKEIQTEEVKFRETP